MLVAYHEQLAARRIVLASQSPRRSELLRMLQLRFDILVSGFDEDLEKSSFASAADYAEETATHKAIDVATKCMQEQELPDLVIGADTVVDLEGRVLEKPSDEADARRMLAELQGRQHQVHTGVALILPKAIDPVLGKAPLVRSFSETTRVSFAPLTETTIAAYVATKEPMDKAGAYGIQGIGGAFVQRVEGCYFNVMGLPVHQLALRIEQLLQEGIL